MGLPVSLNSDRQVLFPQRGFESDPLTRVLTKYPRWQRQFKEDLATVVAVIVQLM